MSATTMGDLPHVMPTSMLRHARFRSCKFQGILENHTPQICLMTLQTEFHGGSISAWLSSAGMGILGLPMEWAMATFWCASSSIFECVMWGKICCVYH